MIYLLKVVEVPSSNKISKVHLQRGAGLKDSGDVRSSQKCILGQAAN